MKSLILLISLTFTANVWADKSDKACELFLKQIDSKEYGKTWDNAAIYFQKAMTKEQWVKSLDAVRTPLLKVFSRKKISKTPKSRLAGAPNGNYMIFQFQSSFAKRSAATETITFFETKDKLWKLVGYFIN